MNRHIWYSPMKDSDLIATESGSEWNLNPRPLNSVQVCQSTELSGHELNSHSEPTLYSYSNFISSFSVYLWFWPLPWSVATFAWSEISHRYSHECSGMNWYILHSPLKDSEKQLQKFGVSEIWTRNWIPFRHSNRLSYQTMCSTRTQSHLCTATTSSLRSVFPFHFGHCLRQFPNLL